MITSGFRSGNLESIFPRGIPIGRVRSASPNEIETYQRVHVHAFADFRRVDYVQVLTARPTVCFISTSWAYDRPPISSAGTSQRSGTTTSAALAGR